VNELFDGFLDDYFAECDEHLTAVRGGLLTLEASVGRRRPDPGVTEELFRSFHSLKGLCGMVEHREGELLAHEMESYLRALRDGDVQLTTAGLETLLDGARSLERVISARRQKTDVPETEPVLEHLRALTSAPTPDSLAPRWECLFTPSPALIARGVNVDLVRKRLREAGSIVSATPIITESGAVAFRFVFAGNPAPAVVEAWAADGMVCTPQRDLDATPAEAPEPVPIAAVEDHGSGTLSSGHYVRVDLARLDELMRMIGDLVILRARLGDSIQRVERHVPAADWRAIQENTTAIERQLRELREGVMRVRLVPVGEIFRRMPFVVRDLTRDSNRKVKVALSGQDTEIDKFLVERMMDPVIHLVRNSVSHGIESVDARIAAGKPPEGTVSLAASASGEMVTIEIADDGRGVDATLVLERARQNGLPIPPVMDDAAVLELICSPGFSTREETDRASGRGFGMAVVRSTVLELGGAMRMSSQPGQGTTFSIDLPLTLAITDALIARVGTQTFAVPQASVREVIEVEAATIRTLQEGDIVPYRGGALPLVRLSTALGIDSAPAGRFHAFIVGSGGAAVGLLVDRILGQREIVVRSALDPLIQVEGVSGATDLGDGRAVLILDAATLVRSASGRGQSPVAAQARGIA
jgi:two-component system chemotaxis sensor kinase CheA